MQKNKKKLDIKNKNILIGRWGVARATTNKKNVNILLRHLNEINGRHLLASKSFFFSSPLICNFLFLNIYEVDVNWGVITCFYFILLPKAKPTPVGRVNIDDIIKTFFLNIYFWNIRRRNLKKKRQK